MLILAAPHSDDPRDDGFNHAIPGELLYRPFVCSSGQEHACGCERSWAGVGSSRATTLAEVIDKPDMTPSEYLNTISLFLAETWDWEVKDAVDEAQTLAAIAEDFGAGAYVTIRIEDDSHVFELMETDHA
ncbi:DUF7715 family protein [Nonomuraea cavernae]|uniref:DUF7715 domain-containing protein n=1 Tax=Nonomuraea cavernae TaxID=2045107 RepID=A0A917Z0G8_9ACTN|nr:hypothetical protein [Nonomuraea cavernae]MCA2187737.1 hypothetical protein [Nonomuraea cavernae]GGO70651.1 hypothetical protein GCM10012289_34550 [Nonomuraea cavernae]